MTFETFEYVDEMIWEEPACTVYRYVHAITGSEMFAVFPPGQYIDVHEAPNVHHPQCLYRHGEWTGYGWEFLYANDYEQQEG